MSENLKQKRVVLTLEQKIDICEQLSKGESRQGLTREFNIGSSTSYDIKKQSDKLEKFQSKSETHKSVMKRHTLHTPVRIIGYRII